MREVAQQAAAGFADFVGAALPRFGLLARVGAAACHGFFGMALVGQLGRQGGHGGSQCLDLVHHRGLGGHQLVGDALAGMAQQARAAEHLHVGVDERADFLLRVLRQHAQPPAQFRQLLAGFLHGGVEALQFGVGGGSGDAGALDLHLGLRRGEHGSDGNARADRNAEENALRRRCAPRFGPVLSPAH